jgi:hypothetical protein
VHQIVYTALDLFFFIFHSLLIIFSLFGWLCRRTRRLHFIVMLCIAFFWFFIGIWYGIGYCPFTDWHWDIRQALGDDNLPYSYIKFLLDSLTGLTFNPVLVDYLTGILFGFAFVASLGMNIRDRIRKERQTQG